MSTFTLKSIIGNVYLNFLATNYPSFAVSAFTLKSITFFTLLFVLKFQYIYNFSPFVSDLFINQLLNLIFLFLWILLRYLIFNFIIHFLSILFQAWVSCKIITDEKNSPWEDTINLSWAILTIHEFTETGNTKTF